MKPAPFLYLRASHMAQALEAKHEHGDEARLLAGGQSLIPLMNARLLSPAVLIDLNPVLALAGVSPRPDGRLRIGAMARYVQLQKDPLVAQSQPLLAETLPWVAHPAIRTRGTLGGNLAQADPIAELSAVALALEARIQVASLRGERWIRAEDFFKGYLRNALSPDELVLALCYPAWPARTGSSFLEVSRRQRDTAMVGVAVRLTLDEAGRCASARIAYCGAGDTPMLAPCAAAMLRGETPVPALFAAAAETAQGEIAPIGTLQAPPEFQQHLAAVLTRRALALAAERALRPQVAAGVLPALPLIPALSPKGEGVGAAC